MNDADDPRIDGYNARTIRESDPLAEALRDAMAVAAKKSSSYDWDWYDDPEVYATLAAALRAHPDWRAICGEPR